MKVEDNHAHAITYYEATSFKQFVALFVSVVKSRLHNYSSLTVHLPLEIQHPYIFKKKYLGIYFIQFGEILKKLFHVKLYWENSPLLEYGSWKLKYGQLNWKNVPSNIEICLDTGHLMIGEKNIKSAQNRIKTILKKYNRSIKHLHVHENNFIADTHLKPSKVLTKEFLEEIMKGRTYIFEK